MPSAIADFASGHRAVRRHAMVGARLHPAHRPVVARLEPAPEIEPGSLRRVGAREAAGDEAEPLCFGAYCLLKG